MREPEFMQLVYAKKFRFPDASANMTQGINMVEAFSSCNVHIHSFFAFAKEIASPGQYLLDSYAISLKNIDHPFVTSQQFRGLRYVLWLLGKIVQTPNCILYTREGTELRRALQYKKCFRFQYPIFHEVHKFETHLFDDSTEAERRRMELRKILSAANGLVFIDAGLQQQATNLLQLETPSCVASSGVNLRHFSNCIPPVSHTEITLAYFGKVVAEKGVHMLLKAFSLLPPNYRLRIIGSTTADDREQLCFLAGDAQNRIEFTGHVPHAALPEAMNGVHISLIPSIFEDQFLSPLKLAESLAMGLPIVCTPMPYLTRILSDQNASVAASTSPEDFAAAILETGSFPKKMEAMRKANLQYAETFSWENRAHHLLEFIRDLVPLSYV